MSATVANNTNPLAESLVRRWQHGVARQANWRNRWRDSTRWIVQHKGTETATDGSAQTTHIFDTTAAESAEIMASGMLTHTAPAGEQWFQLRETGGDDGELARWLDGASKRQIEIIHASNFYEDAFECFVDLAAFSICAMFTEEIDDGEGPVNFVQIPVGTFVIEENQRGRVGALIREFEFTARQAADKWGVENLSEKMREELKNALGGRDKQFKILHCLYKREDVTNESAAPANKRPWASVYIDHDAKHVIEEGGYYEQPFAVCRLMRGNSEIYGRGPADKAMPLIKTINAIERDRLLGTNLAINPGWTMPHDSAYRPDNRPGGVTYWDSTNPNNKPERQQVEARLDWAQLYAEEKREQIRAAFYVPMFHTLNNPDTMKREKTAREVAEIVQEKLILFSPIFGRLVSEFFNPVLRRVFGILLRKGNFDPPPQGVDIIDFKVEYVSKIALAIRSAQSGALLSIAEIIAQISQIDPTAPLAVKWPESVRFLARNYGLPVELQRTEEEFNQIVQAQQQAAAMQQVEQAASAAQKGAAAAKNLGPEAQRAMTEAMGGAA